MGDAFGSQLHEESRVCVGEPAGGALNRQRDGNWTPDRSLTERFPALRGLRMPLQTAKETVARVVETARLAGPVQEVREQHLATLETKSLAVRDALERLATGAPGQEAQSGREIAGCARRLAEAAEAAATAAPGGDETRQAAQRRGRT